LERRSGQRRAKAEIFRLRTQGAVGCVRSPSALQTLPGQITAGRAQDATATFARNVRVFVSRRQIITWTLIQPGARECSCVHPRAKSLAFNLSLPCPGCSASDDVEAALDAACFLVSMGCQMSEPELHNQSVIIVADMLVAFSTQQLPSLVALVICVIQISGTKAWKCSDSCGYGSDQALKAARLAACLVGEWLQPSQLLAPGAVTWGFLQAVCFSPAWPPSRCVLLPTLRLTACFVPLQ